jgi:hypothetical protein
MRRPRHFATATSSRNRKLTAKSMSATSPRAPAWSSVRGTRPKRTQTLQTLGQKLEYDFVREQLPGRHEPLQNGTSPGARFVPDQIAHGDVRHFQKLGEPAGVRPLPTPGAPQNTICTPRSCDVGIASSGLNSLSTNACAAHLMDRDHRVPTFTIVRRPQASHCRHVCQHKKIFLKIPSHTVEVKALRFFSFCVLRAQEITNSRTELKNLQWIQVQ